ncbi:class I SAM-dependent methyltransferase [Candidatus Leptofilum sp.]|uniref:class I SAM-dependent methyltransferase n=1 Tax=Candidatus Leptofilum sp. TaxID=3241576 RepID=UPI003B5C284C
MTTMLANRLRKRMRHLRKWASRNDISCYRLYERDIPEFPLIVDWYDGEAVVWLYARSKDDNEAWQQDALTQIGEALALSPRQIFVKTRSRQRGLRQQYERFGQKGHVRLVQEQGLTFEVNLSDYLDTGLFLDHRQTRAMVRDEAAGKRVLNLFAYTGSFTVYAAAGKAKATTTVDLSKKYCDWARRNLQHNGFRPDRRHRVVAQDCWQFLVEDKRSYDLIVCDPPTFSNSKRMARSAFAVDRDHPELIHACLARLASGGTLIFSTNSRGFKLDESALPHAFAAHELTPQTIPEDFRNDKIHRCWRIEKR